MNFSELNYIVNEQQKIKRHSRIGMTNLEDSGSSHPLWNCLAVHLNPTRFWYDLNGAERGQLVRAAKKLHEANIPYSFYATFLYRMGKTGLLRANSLTLTKYKSQKSGTPSILGEYLSMMEYLIKIFKERPDTIRITDEVHKVLPGSYRHGALKYVHTVRTIYEALETHTTNEVLQVLNRCDDIKEFWNALGKSTEENPVKEDIDLSAGHSAPGVIKILQREIRIRLGKEPGEPSIKLNKYFNKHNRLNIRGLKVVSGERGL